MLVEASGCASAARRGVCTDNVGSADVENAAGGAAEIMSGQLGKSMLRKEDPALLSGRGRYADDLPVAVGTLHAHVIRSPHAHAEIRPHRCGARAGA